jgi:hypothetical protein
VSSLRFSYGGGDSLSSGAVKGGSLGSSSCIFEGVEMERWELIDF